MPVLRDFQLILNDPNWDQDAHRRFASDAKCVVSFFRGIFPKFTSPCCGKLLIECMGQVRHENVEHVEKIAVVELQFDAATYFSIADNFGKKKRLLDLLFAGIEKAAGHHGWDIGPFSSTRDRMLEQGLENKFTWSKKAVQKSRRLTAEIEVNHDIDAAYLTLQVKDKSGAVVHSELLWKGQPSEVQYGAYLEKLVWQDENTIVLLGMNGRQLGPVKLPLPPS